MAPTHLKPRPWRRLHSGGLTNVTISRLGHGWATSSGPTRWIEVSGGQSEDHECDPKRPSDLRKQQL